MSPIHLISSSSYRILEEEIKKITKDNPITYIDNNQISLEEIIEEAAYISLFDDKKYIVIKNCTIFNIKRNQKEEQTTEETDNKKNNKDEELLNKYLDNPNPNTILIFAINQKPAMTKKITKKIKEQYNLITLTDMNYKELQDRIIRCFKENKYTYEQEVPYYITTSCQNNYDLIYNELEKIKLFYNNKTNKVLLKDIENIIARPLEDNSFKFIEKVLEKNLKESMRMFNDLYIQKVAPIMLLILLSREYRNTLYALHFRNNYNKQELMQKLNIKYEFQIDKIINRTYNYKEKELEDILLYIADLNYKMLSGKLDHKTAIELLILNNCN